MFRKKIIPKESLSLIRTVKHLRKIAKNKYIYIITDRKRGRYFIRKDNLIYSNKNHY